MKGAARLFLLAALSGLIGLAPTPSSSIQTVPLQPSPITLPPAAILPATVRTDSWQNIPIINVTMNSSRIERAAIATGLNADVVTPEASQRLKLGALPGQVRFDVLNSTSTADQAELAHLILGTLDLKMSFAVSDVPKLLSSRQQDPPPPTTWLGTPFLSAFLVTLDPGSSSITLDKPTAKLPRAKDQSVVKLQIRSGRPYVQVSVAGAPSYWALVDTSSPGSMAPTAVAEKLKLKPLKVDPVSWRDGKPGKVATIVVPRIGIGKAEWKMARIISFTPDSSKEYDRTFAVIGMDFLGRFRVTIDFLHSQMLLSPKVAPVDPSLKPDTP